MDSGLREFLEITALVASGIVGIFGAGRWFGWKHRELISGICDVKDALKEHIADENVVFERIERRIERIEKLCNGGLRQ